ncbi:hypothetical protein SAMN05216359_101361 [Roseateles sp. YR242]|uniref:OTU domain-containing protein n=1 Tax=Roseateles sp. YR242 TaxID=1855305 RepID=UPI0008C7326C|nr:OTU domain-containing protein [Roseateles sp. YR242]SEK30496.1 hypothetical protein SAMN05216359_101361 [Roseateles sp. YR242]
MKYQPITPNAGPSLYSHGAAKRAARPLPDEMLPKAAAYAARAWTLTAATKEPRLSAHARPAERMLECALLDLLMWMHNVDTDEIRRDSSLQQMPRMNVSLLGTIRRACPSEAELLIKSLGDWDALWDFLKALAPPTLAAHMNEKRAELNRDIRTRVMHWLNDLRRDVGSAGPRFDPGCEPQPTKPAPAKKINMPLLQEAAKSIRQNGEWNSLGGDIAPFAMPHVPGWPAHRALEIRDLKGTLLERMTPSRLATDKPVILILDTDRRHYSAQLDGKTVAVPDDGNCFYHAVLRALGPHDRARLVTTIGNEHSYQFSKATLMALRNATADELIQHPWRYQSALELLELVNPSGGRR